MVLGLYGDLVLVVNAPRRIRAHGIDPCDSDVFKTSERKT